MKTRSRINPRLLVGAVIAVAALLALVFAVGGFYGSSSGSGPQSTPPATPNNHVQGTVEVSVRHIKGHTWEFRYVVRNTGSVPIAGFQLNARPSNLFQISAQPKWSYYGSGVCGRKSSVFLIYWSTGTRSRTVIQPQHAARFAFRVNTSGTSRLLYSLSWGSAAPQFGHVTGPARSSLRTSGACG